MADVTVSQFAQVLKVPVDRLLAQLDQAGIKVAGPEDRITDEAKLELLTHLRRSHGAESDGDGAPRRITLKRKTQGELRLASDRGRTRTVNVEVRSTRKYIKRDVLQERARQQQEDFDQQKQREAEQAARLESERIEAERRERERIEAIEAENRRRIEEEQSRKKAQEEARRIAEQQAREEAERHDREAQRRADGEPQRAGAESRVRAAERAPVERAAPEVARSEEAAARAQPTRYGREELHVATDVSSRFKKKKRVKARPLAMSGDGRHAFEMPTAPVKRAVSVGETITVAELAQK